MAEQVGGRLIGEGVYGCAFMPPLLCKGDSKPITDEKNKIVSKIATSDEIEQEIQIAKVLRTIPLSRNYFIYSLDEKSCQPAAENKQVDSKGFKRRDIYECGKRESQGSLTYFRMYRMPYGGVLIANNRARFNYWRLGKHLLEGLSLLLVSGIVHLDLHSKNIVIDEFRVPRIFDWGFANQGPFASSENLRDILVQKFSTRYTQQPPELQLFIKANIGGSIDEAMTQIFVGRRDTISKIQELLGVDRAIIYQQLEEFRNKTLYLEKTPNFAAWWRTHWPTYDSWSLGYILLKLAYDLNKGDNPIFSKPEYADKVDKIKTALRGMCNFNCFDRLNAVQALAIWDSPQNPIIVRYGQKWL